MRIAIYIPDDTSVLEIKAIGDMKKVLTEYKVELLDHKNKCIVCKENFLSVRKAKYCSENCKTVEGLKRRLKHEISKLTINS